MDNSLPTVVGRGMIMTIADHERAALVCIAAEMAKPNSDNALIMVLAEAVRMGREYVDSMQNKCVGLLPAQASNIMDAHEITALLANEEELELLERNNPELLEAYCALHRIAVGANTVTQGGDDYAAEDERRG